MQFLPPSRPTKRLVLPLFRPLLSSLSAHRTSRPSRVQVSFNALNFGNSHLDSRFFLKPILNVLFQCFIGVMALLRPLLLDNVPSIQQSAALALGRLANYSDELAEAVVSNEILPQLVYSLSEQNVSQLEQHSLSCRTFDINLNKNELASNNDNVLTALFAFLTEILQEGCCLRAPLCRQALSSPRQGCCALWCSRCPC